MNLFKVKKIHHISNETEWFTLDNDIWACNYNPIEYGAHIKGSDCVIYLNNEMHVDLDKFELAAKNIKRYENLKINRKLVVLNEKNAVWISINLYEGEEWFRNTHLTIEEYLIKQILE